MKTIIWIAGSVLILGGVVSFFSFRFKGIETPNYKVIKTIGDVEIREYPQMILAQTKLGLERYLSFSSGKSLSESDSFIQVSEMIKTSLSNSSSIPP